jgi:hypothetical protein
MDWNKESIRLAAAALIFEECDINEITIDGKTAGYTATYRGQKYESRSLATLCRALWLAAQAPTE